GGTSSWYVDATYAVDGVFYLNSKVTLLGITDGTGNTFLAGERFHYDPVYTNISTLGGWAWSNFQAVQDCIGSTRTPLNYQIPLGTPNTFAHTDPRVSAFGSRHTNRAQLGHVRRAGAVREHRRDRHPGQLPGPLDARRQRGGRHAMS